MTNPVPQTDAVFLKHFAQLITFLVVVCILLILLGADIYSRHPSLENPAQATLVDQRLAPVGAVYAGATGQAAISRTAWRPCRRCACSTTRPTSRCRSGSASPTRRGRRTSSSTSSRPTTRATRWRTTRSSPSRPASRRRPRCAATSPSSTPRCSTTRCSRRLGAVVTEYAWTTSGCDPCPGPILSPEELLTLGGDVIAASYGEQPFEYTMTRLHARYGKEIADDLVFRAVEPLQGGRSLPDASGVLAADT